MKKKIKDLTPLEAFYELKKIILDLFVDIGDCHNNLKIIETAVKDYEMEHTLRVRLENINYELVREKQANEKKLKALEIITKSFDFDVEAGSLPDGTPTYKLNVWCKGTPTVVKLISKEQFDLLKEVLK